MAEYIEREAVMQAFSDYVWNSNHSDLVPAPQWNHAVDIVRDYPTADVVLVRHGRWIVDDISGIFKCSECKNDAPLDTTGGGQWCSPFCHSCGARMDKDGDGE